LLQRHNPLTGYDLFRIAVEQANHEQSAVFKFCSEQTSKIRTKRAALFLRMRGGPQFNRADFEALTEFELMNLFAPNLLVVGFDVVLQDNENVSPVNLEDL